jgi:redox-sensitive bicupin YhaK (pirin superfamily)
MRAQEYQDLAPARLAEARLSAAGSVARVIAGEVDGAHGPVRERATRPLLFTVALEDDAPFTVDVTRGHNAFVFVHAGEIEIGPVARPTMVNEGTLAILEDGARVRLRARSRRSVAIVAAARPLHEPIVRRGPFVMNTAAEIEKAFADYRAGTLDA